VTEEERKQRAREKSRKWRAENRERHRAYSRDWQLRNHDYYLAKMRAYYASLPIEEKRAKRRAWRENNRERYRENARSDQRRRSVGRSQESVDYAEILRRDPCSYCGGEGGVIEHIDSLKAGGTNEWANLTGSCARCNGRKRTKTLLLFLLTRNVTDR